MMRDLLSYLENCAAVPWSVFVLFVFVESRLSLVVYLLAGAAYAKTPK